MNIFTRHRACAMGDYYIRNAVKQRLIRDRGVLRITQTQELLDAGLISLRDVDGVLLLVVDILYKNNKTHQDPCTLLGGLL
jgi:hypothetical protein